MELYITVGLIMLASLSGLIFSINKNFGDWFYKNSKFIIAFSSGIFAVVTYDMISESMEMSLSVWVTLGAVVFGFLLLQIIEKLFPELHHHEDEHAHCHHTRRKVLLGDAFHNVGDGILLALAFSADSKVGLVAAFGIFIHEFVQELGKFSILKHSGLSTKKALILNFLVSTTIIIGVALGMYTTNIQAIAGILAGLAAGVFMHLIFVDLIPHSFMHSKKDKKYFVYLFLIIAGIFTILAINQFAGEEHGEGTPETQQVGQKTT
ncbi:MAG: hypothetical protein RLZZ517_581 [Candidatus Parcubacteria bacterium]|jgi:zinc and cadmium transporter